tara:strand:- start:1476 stop:1991 length:516 start_codon:yes stop_codon:yes gene_type:complete
MSILYNKKHILSLVGIYFAIFLVEIYLYDIRLPIKSLNYFPIKIDLIFIYLTILVFYFEKAYIVIYIAFVSGLFQGMVTSVDVGLVSFLKSFFIFLFILIKNYKNIWNYFLKLVMIFSIYFIYYLIFYFIVYSPSDLNTFISYSSIGLVHAIVLFVIFYIFNKLLFNSKLY